MYHEQMAGLVQIRDVPDDVRHRLKSRAAAHGVSLNSYLLRLLERDATRPTAAEVFERARRRTESASHSSLRALDAERAGRQTSADRTPTPGLSGPSG